LEIREAYNNIVMTIKSMREKWVDVHGTR